MDETAVGTAGPTSTPTRRVVVKPLQWILGALMGLAILVLLQQYGVTTFTITKAIVALLLGAAFGFGLSNLAAMIAQGRAKKTETEMTK